MAFDNVFRPVGSTLVDLYGVPSTYTAKTDSGIDTTTGLPSTTENSQTLTMTPPSAYKIEEVDGSIIQSHDMNTYIAGEAWDLAFPSVQPQIGDEVTINGQEYTVVNPNPVYSGLLVAAYKLQLRRG